VAGREEGDLMGARQAVLLLSGGLDSATTLALAREQGFDVHALTVRYGQRHAIEIERAKLIARQLGAVAHRVVDVDLAFPGGSALTDAAIEVPTARTVEEIGRGIPATYVPARNTVFLSIALAWAETLGAHDIFIGINAVDYSGYPDCRPEYLSAFETLARLATKAGVEGAEIRIHAPLIELSKAQIIGQARRLGVNLDITISCYNPSPEGDPCKVCESCLLRERGFQDADS
jgi:7-cyano-7-deazaguanine synthase